VKPAHVLAAALCAAVPILLSAGCEEPQAVAGSSSETENVLTARIYGVDSLLQSWNHPRWIPTVATLRLDSASLPFPETRADGSDLRVERLDSVPLPFRIVFWDRVAAKGRIQVRLDPPLQREGSRIRLRWASKDSTRPDSAAVWRSIPDSQRLALTSTRVDDFERGTLRSQLPDSGMWYTLSGDSGEVTQPGIAAAGRGRSGNALHFGFMGEKGWVYCGLPLAGGRTRNFRSLDSLVFWVRGPAKLAVGFDHHERGKAWAHRMIDSNWTRIALAPSGFDSANGAGGNIGWNAVRDSVTDLVFFVSQGSDLWLDDIRIHGVDRDDLR